MFRTLLIAFIIAFVGITVVEAQPYHEPSYEQLLDAARENHEEHFYYNAIELYKECFDVSRDDTLLYLMAELEFKMRDYERAKRLFERIMRGTEPEDLLEYDILFLYARTERILGDYNRAYNIYESFLTLSSNDSLKNLARNDIEGMILATDYELRYDLYVTAFDEPVNSAFSEYSPVEAPDGTLYWTSFGRNTVIKFDKDGGSSGGKSKGDNWYAHIVRSKKGLKGEWDQPAKLDERLNRPKLHTTNNTFSPDGNYMFLNQQTISGQQVVASKILISRKSGDGWETPKEVESVNGDWLALYPTYGELFGQEVMFFASDMPGSMGGLDLYYAPKRGEFTYGDPVNLGETINSAGDERTPHYVDGRLYFSSDGHPGMGGLDIFSSEWDGRKWSEPKNMESGYNSRYDDFYFVTNAEEDKGYLVSNRPNQKIRSLRSETCCDDIYQIGIREVEIDLLTAVFSSSEPLLDATVEVVEIIKGKRTENVTSLKSPKGNTYRFPLQADKEYRIISYKDGYATDSTELSTMDVVHSYTYKKQFSLTQLEPETRTVTINEPIRLNNIYYDFDAAKILPESEPSLNEIHRLMLEYDNMVIELSAHTDSRGNNDYNMNLSQRRAENAKKFLTDKGIPSARVIAKGYGETKILNGCVDGVECSEEEHRFNRRTEFKIVEGPTTIEVKKEVLEGKKEPGAKPKGKLNIPGKQGYETEEKLPILNFHTPFYDFGLIKSGSPASTEFTFTNVGEDALMITFATARNCKIQWPESPVLPGETGTIFVTFDTSIVGEREINVNVLANTEPTVSEARFRAFVNP